MALESPNIDTDTHAEQDASGFSALLLVGAIAVLGILVAVGLVVSNSQTQDSKSLVPIEGPKNVRLDNEYTESAATPSTKASEAVIAYSNTPNGFSFAYPSAWGALQPSEVDKGAALLNLATTPLQDYSLADNLRVRVDTLADFKIQIGTKGVLVSPTPSGSGYTWTVVDKGSDRITVGKTYPTVPQVVYKSGKAVVYNFPSSRDNCTYATWVFAVQTGMARLRLPAFCISDKAADADVQAEHKADFEKAKAALLRSITVQ